jgi:hypothetical protein
LSGFVVVASRLINTWVEFGEKKKIAKGSEMGLGFRV